VLTGRVVMGSVKIRGPRRQKFGRLRAIGPR
jgi:hypothetical protein